MRFDQQFVKSVVPEVTFMGSDYLPEDWSMNVDSRSIKKGEIFIALRGKNSDGHDFVKEAVARGASGVIISEGKKDVLKQLSPSGIKSLFIAIVPNSEEALFKLAGAWRQQFNYPVIGITGSIGKTSTKEILSNILKLNKTKFIATHENQNTEIGISINILNMRADHEVAVFEMGISKRLEMARLAKLVRPTTAIITTIGHSHMEGLGSLVDIANEKRNIFKYFKEDNIGIINGDLPILANISYNHPIVKFGCKTTNQVQARKIQSNNLHTHFVIKLYKSKHKVMLHSNHAGRVMNCLAAAAAAYLLKIPQEVIVTGIQIPVSISGRFEQAQLKSSKGILINDCYNASPESMKAALSAFEKLESKGQKIAVLGDMLELGVNSSFWHRQLGRFLRKVPSLNHVVLVGNMVKWTRSTIPLGLSFEHVSNWEEATDALRKKLDRESVVLVKGSQGMQLTNIVSELTEGI